MIVTLAGHVDHGKTTLVTALTGVNTDRLAEERARGLTIDLGFAYRQTGEQTLGFVDVPGHHRFVHNMIAGVASHQTALLVVAADDGPMPQTREHLQILSLIGVRRGVIALTKCDRVDNARIDAARAEIKALTQHSFIANAPIIETRLDDDQSTAVLFDALIALEPALEETSGEGFRLAIDRAFNVRGSGTVVTGTVHSGQLAVGDTVLISPIEKSVRVRGLRAQNAETDRVSVGDRAAINLAGIDLQSLERGQWLVEPALHAPTRNVTIELDVLADFPRAIRHWLPVHAYLGTSHRQARIGLLAPGKLEPGSKALVDVVVDETIDARLGDVVILRDHGLDKSIGGGRVVWADNPGRRRRNPNRLARLALAEATPIAGLADALLNVEPTDLGHLQRLGNRTQPLRTGAVVEVSDGHAIAEALWTHEVARQESRLSNGEATRRELADTASNEALGRAVSEDLVRRGIAVDDSGKLRLKTQVPSLDPFAKSLLDRVTPHLDSEAPLSLGDVAARMKMTSKELSDAIAPLDKAGALLRVSKTRLMLPNRVAGYEASARALAASEPFSVRQFCDATGLGRNAAIEMLEYFDRTGLTMRRDNVRMLRPGA